jgi:protein-S-isoprenylcysteine O-methyltransferase Ste14
MFCGFVFVNIPAQDRYLEERYGEEYRLYAKRTARLIPYIY